MEMTGKDGQKKKVISRKLNLGPWKSTDSQHWDNERSQVDQRYFKGLSASDSHNLMMRLQGPGLL